MIKYSSHKKNTDTIMKGTWHLVNTGILTENLEFSHEQRSFLKKISSYVQNDELMRILKYDTGYQWNPKTGGSKYWCFRKQGEIVGLTGIHCRMWDHPSVVWATPCMTLPGMAEQTRIGLFCNNILFCITRTQFGVIYFVLKESDDFGNNVILSSALAAERVVPLPEFCSVNQDMQIFRLDLNEMRRIGKNKYGLDLNH